MLFSNDQVAQFIHERFEPAWEMVREVPVVRIDFGRDNVLTRTLNGNIATYVCTAEGQVLDALPGVYTPAAYKDALDQFSLLASFVSHAGPPQVASRSLYYHRMQAEALRKNETPVRLVLGMGNNMAKAAIEEPVKFILNPTAAAKPAAAQVKSGTPPEAVVGKVPGGTAQELATWDALVADTQRNETVHRLKIHEMLARTGMVHPNRIVKPLYRDVLDTDLDDPYLGLGKTLFASYPFAREDAR